MLRRGSRGPAVVDLQKKLAAAGYDPGAADGIFGPRTEAALRQFQSAAKIQVDGVYGPQSQQALTSTPAKAEGQEEPSTPEEAAVKSNDEALEYIRENYPAYAFLLDHSELGPVLRKAAQEEWTPQKFQSAIEQTAWFQETAATAREMELLQGMDPKEYERRLDLAKMDVANLGRQMGVNLSEEDVLSLAENSLFLGLDSAQLRTYVTNLDGDLIEVDDFGTDTSGGEVSEYLSRIDALSGDYMVDLSDEQKKEWVGNMLDGKTSLASFEKFMKTTAARLNPWAQNFIDNGVTVRQGLQPYQQSIASVLERNPADIDMKEAKWHSSFLKEDGSLASMHEVKQNVRNNFRQEWERTSGAKQSAMTTARYLAQQFGVR